MIFHFFAFSNILYLTELEALTDELALDTDTSYLDEVTTPKVPTKEPGTETESMVDEFGLPKIQAT